VGGCREHPFSGHEADRDANGWADVFERDKDADGVLDYQDADYEEKYYQMRMPGYDYDYDGLYDDDDGDGVLGFLPGYIQNIVD
jgi:hypothetical protein